MLNSQAWSGHIIYLQHNECALDNLLIKEFAKASKKL